MANRRMFSFDVIDDDKFIDMSAGARVLYFHLGMVADDDGFIGAPMKVMRSYNASNGDMTQLIERGYLMLFDSGVVCITHWRMNNFLRSDRYKPSVYKEERAQLGVYENGKYGLLSENPQLRPLDEARKGIPSGNRSDAKRDTDGIPDGIPSGIPSGNRLVYPVEDSIDKTSTDKNKGRKGKDKDGAHAPTRAAGFMRPSVDEIRAYCSERGYTHVDAEYFWNYYENIGWRVGKNKMKSWKLAVANWEKRHTEFEREKRGSVPASHATIVTRDPSENQKWGLFDD